MDKGIYKLKDICQIKSGKRIPLGMDFSSDKTEHPYIRARDIKDGKIYTDDLLYIDDNVHGKIKKYIIHSGDIAITIVGASVGDVSYADDSVDGYNLTENAVRLTNFDSTVNAKYVFYQLVQKQYREYMQTVAGGAAQPKLGIYKVERIKVALPSKTEQDRIVKILDSYENLIEVNNKRIKVLEQMAENLYKEWFVCFRFPDYEIVEFDKGKPKKWPELRLEQFGITLDSGARPSGGIDDSLEDGMPSLGAEAINGLGEFDYKNVKLIPYEFYAEMNRGKNTGKDILVYKDGAYIGKTTIFMNKFPYEHFAVNEHVFLLNAIDSEYQLYLYFTLHLPEYYTLMQNLNRNAAQPGLSKPDLYRIKLIVPDNKTIHQFILMDGTIPIGQIRVNVEQEKAEINYSISNIRIQ